MFLKSLGIFIPVKYNLKVYVAGLAMIVTPASSGSLIKSYILEKKFGYAYSKTMPVIIAEKFHDLLAPLSIIAIILIFIDFFEARLIVFVICFVMLGVFLLVRNKKLLTKAINKISKLNILKNFQENFLEFYDSFHILSNKKTIISGWMLGTVSIFVDGIAIYLGFLALGIDLEFIETFVTVFTANILGMISFIPGGFGVTEVSLLSFLLKGGLAFSTASVAVLITRFTGVWFQIILGFIFKIRILKDIQSN